MGKRLLYKPIAHTTLAGEVAVYVGGSYARLTIDEATVMRDQLAAAIDELCKRQIRSTDAITSPPCEPFAKQLGPFRLQVTDAGRARLDESLAMAEIDKEAQS